VKLIRLRSAILLLNIFFLAVACTDTAAAGTTETLPPIDAHRFDVKPLQKSASGKIYLFESNQVIPKTGNLILIYDEDKPAMAFRVLKNDRFKKQFVGKRVRRYDQTNELKIDQAYPSIEKLADVLLPPPNEAPSTVTDQNSPALTDQKLSSIPDSSSPTSTSNSQDTSDLPDPGPVPENSAKSDKKQTTGDLESENRESEKEPSNSLEKKDKASLPEEDEDEGSDQLEIDETSRIEPFNNVLSISTGYFTNASNFSGLGVLNNGFSISFAHSLISEMLFRSKTSQDSLGIELGGIYYRIINKDGGNDIYSMLPFYGELTYQIHFSQAFALGLYGGIQYNYMTSATNPGASLSSLQGPQVNAGLGVFFGIGPQWLLRADVGWDRITGGLGIKW